MRPFKSILGTSRRIGNTKTNPTTKLVFDPARLEGDTEDNICGSVLGGGSCLTAGIVGELLKGSKSPQFDRGMSRGFMAMRALLEHGHGPAKGEPFFPINEIKNALDSRVPHSFQVRSVPVDKDGGMKKKWSFLEESAPSENPMYGLARRTILYGIQELEHSPHGRFGHLFTADRFELESYNSLRRKILWYHTNCPEYAGRKEPRPDL